MFNILLIIPYAFALRLGLYFNMPKYQLDDKAWIYNKIADIFHFNGPYQYLWSIILVLIQAFLINYLVNRYKLNSEGQLFAGIVFIVLTGMHPATATIGPVQLANVFLILAMTQIMGIYIKKQAALQLYNFGLFIGLASLIYPPYIWFLVLGIAGITILKSFNWKEWLQLMAGWINVVFLLFVLVYFTGTESEFYNIQIKAYLSSYIIHLSPGLKGLILMIILFILLLLTLIQYNFYRIKRIVIIQKYYDFMFWTSFCSLLSLFFVKIEDCSHLILLITPLSILVALLLTKIKNPLLSETVHLLFAFSALFLQIQNW